VADAIGTTAPTKALRGVPLESLGLAIGHWIPVEVGGQVGSRMGLVAATIVGMIGFGALIAGQAAIGAILVVAAAVGGLWLHVAKPAATVRLYDRGFELEHGSQQVAIAFAKLVSATLHTTEYTRYGVRVRWGHRLELTWDLGQLTLTGEEPGQAP